MHVAVDGHVCIRTLCISKDLSFCQTIYIIDLRLWSLSQATKDTRMYTAQSFRLPPYSWSDNLSDKDIWSYQMSNDRLTVIMVSYSWGILWYYCLLQCWSFTIFEIEKKFSVSYYQQHNITIKYYKMHCSETFTSVKCYILSSQF